MHAAMLLNPIEAAEWVDEMGDLPLGSDNYQYGWACLAAAVQALAAACLLPPVLRLPTSSVACCSLRRPPSLQSCWF